MISEFLPALKMFIAMTVLTGIAYPLAMTGIAQGLFKSQANGSLIIKNGKVVGSELIGQEFKEARFFHSRPSATGYNPMPSGASNLAPTSADLLKAIEERKTQGATLDLLFTSGSGLDPHISPEAAYAQISRVSKENGIDSASLESMIHKNSQGRTFGFLGESRVNVLMLNLDLLEAHARLSSKSR